MKARSAARYALGQLYEVRGRSCASCGRLPRVYCPGLSGESEVSGVAEDAVSDSSVSVGIGIPAIAGKALSSLPTKEDRVDQRAAG